MNDATHMRRALELADEALGNVSPRPAVGAVVVGRDGRVLGEGATQPDPGPHAEVVAIQRAAGRAKGATLYVSLEPCSHTGSTPPCADAVIAAGIRRVVAARRDPNPAVSGRGLRRLRAAGLEVTTGVASRAAGEVIAPFARWVRSGRPLVTLKMAASLDGKVAAADGTSRWITGDEARAEVHELRARVDAILVGARTVAIDDPQLTARTTTARRPALRVVADSSGRTSPRARIFDGAAPALVLTTAAAPITVRRAWSRRGAEVAVLGRGEGGVDLEQSLDVLGKRGVCHLLVEGGPSIAGAFVEAGLADRLLVYLAPKLIGGDAPGVLASGIKTIADARPLRVTGIRRVGGDLRIDAVPETPAKEA